MQKIWITGSNGQIGKAINEVLNPLDYEVFDTDKEELDITNLKDVLKFCTVNRPQVIINCAGITNNMDCQKDSTLAYKVNALGARNLSIAASKIDAKFVQISTDDVFDGKNKKPITEFEQTRPLTIYGKSKEMGEQFVKEFTTKHFIIRSSWVYGDGDNFVTYLLNKVQHGDVVDIAGDQIGSPTSAKELARLILHLINTSKYGTYHATCRGLCSRYEFAQEILKLANVNGKLNRVTTSESEYSVNHPTYAVLNNFILTLDNDYALADWQSALQEYLKEKE